MEKETLNQHAPYDFKTGALLLVDKPLEWTSFDVVNKLRFAIKKKLNVKKIKVGHAGTLDPLATGLLLICTGKYTKKLQGLQGLSKSYAGTFKFGATTPSFDAETEEDQQFDTSGLTAEKIKAVADNFIGEQEQLPPMFSAIKVDGQPLYKTAREGKKVEVKPRKITIHDFKITNVDVPYADFWVEVSKGTYIRSLAYDMGKALENGAYLSALRRTTIGDFSIDDAWDLEELVQNIQSEE